MTSASRMPTKPLYDSTDSLLRFAMRAYASLTGLMGLAVVFVAGPVSSSLMPVQEYGLGVFFVCYGLVVFCLAALPNLRRVGISVVVANIVYTLAAIVAAAVVPTTTTAAGVTLAGAVYAAVFAVLQYLGVRRLAA